MKEVKNSELAQVHGGADEAAVDVGLMPCVVSPPTTTVPDATTTAPTLTEKHVEV